MALFERADRVIYQGKCFDMISYANGLRKLLLAENRPPFASQMQVEYNVFICKRAISICICQARWAGSVSFEGGSCALAIRVINVQVRHDNASWLIDRPENQGY